MSIFLVSPSFGINSCTAEHSEHSHCEIETTDVHTVTSSPEPFAIDSPLWFHTSLHTNEGSVPSTFSSCAVSYTVIVPDVTLAKIFHRETSNINDSLENLAQHIFMSPGSAYSLLPETNGLKVKSRTERWRLNTGLQILKSKVLGVYAYTYPLHLKVVLLLLFWGQKKKQTGGTLITILPLIWGPRVSILNGSELLAVWCVLWGLFAWQEWESAKDRPTVLKFMVTVRTDNAVPALG